MSTGAEVLRETASLIGGLVWPPQGVSALATGGTTTTLIDTGENGLRDANLSEHLLDGLYLLFLGGVGAAVTAGTWRMLQPGGYVPGSGQIAWSEPVSAVPAGFDEYCILSTLDPPTLANVINRALGRLRHPARVPLSLIPDADMEASDTDSWSAAGGAAVAKLTSDGLGSGHVLEGTRSLYTNVNATIIGYVQSATLPVNPGDSYALWVDYHWVSGSGAARARAYDVTNSAYLGTATDPDEGANSEGGCQRLSFTIPATCRQIAIRLDATATAVLIWDNLILRRNGRTRYPLPAWIEERSQIVDFVLRSGNRPSEYHFASAGHPIHVDEDPTAVSAFEVELPRGLGGQPVYLAANRNYASLGSPLATFLAASTACPLEWIAYAAAAQALEEYGSLLTGASRTQAMIEKGALDAELLKLSARYAPRDGRPLGHRTEWVADVGNPFLTGGF